MTFLLLRNVALIAGGLLLLAIAVGKWLEWRDALVDDGDFGFGNKRNWAPPPGASDREARTLSGESSPP